MTYTHAEWPAAAAECSARTAETGERWGLEPTADGWKVVHKGAYLGALPAVRYQP